MNKYVINKSIKRHQFFKDYNKLLRYLKKKLDRPIYLKIRNIALFTVLDKIYLTYQVNNILGIHNMLVYYNIPVEWDTDIYVSTTYLCIYSSLLFQLIKKLEELKIDLRQPVITNFLDSLTDMFGVAREIICNDTLVDVVYDQPIIKSTMPELLIKGYIIISDGTQKFKIKIDLHEYHK